MIGVGLIGLLAKLHKWDESAVYFDGSSLGGHLSPQLAFLKLIIWIAAYVFALAIYLTVTVPSLRTIVEPLGTDDDALRLEAMRVLSAGNIIIIFLLGAILGLQVCSLKFAMYQL